MRRMILTTLVLLPVMAHAQAITSIEPQPSTSSAVLLAEVKLGGPPALAALNTVSRVGAIQGGTREYAMFGSIPAESSEPSVTHAVEVGLSPAEMAGQPAVIHVIVHATVDVYGVPRNLSISKSAGAAVDEKVLAAVSQYRFRPATLENQPVDAAVTISIKIQKP